MLIHFLQSGRPKISTSPANLSGKRFCRSLQEMYKHFLTLTIFVINVIVNHPRALIIVLPESVVPFETSVSNELYFNLLSSNDFSRFFFMFSTSSLCNVPHSASPDSRVIADIDQHQPHILFFHRNKHH